MNALQLEHDYLPSTEPKTTASSLDFLDETTRMLLADCREGSHSGDGARMPSRYLLPWHDSLDELLMQCGDLLAECSGQACSPI